MVFQSYALFPHLTVEREHRLRPRRARRAEARGGRAGPRGGRSSWAARSCSHGGRHELSGGERQRVALARALVREPALLPARRAAVEPRRAAPRPVRAELKALHRRVGRDDGPRHARSDRGARSRRPRRGAATRGSCSRSGRRTRSGPRRANRFVARFVGTPADERPARREDRCAPPTYRRRRSSWASAPGARLARRPRPAGQVTLVEPVGARRTSICASSDASLVARVPTRGATRAGRGPFASRSIPRTCTSSTLRAIGSDRRERASGTRVDARPVHPRPRRARRDPRRSRSRSDSR